MNSNISKDNIEGLKETIRNLYLADDIPWVIGYSGGKDSTATLQIVWLALKELESGKAHKTVHVINTDTLVESPIIERWVQNSFNIMNETAKKDNVPIITHRLTPDVNDTYWVNLIGRGYPFPRMKVRWCTDRLKIRPVNTFVKSKIAEHGEIILVLGTRKAESSRRARTMAFYEKKRVRDLLSPNPSLANELVFSPLENWTDDDVWTFLMQYKNPWGLSNKELMTLYRGATADNECPLMTEKNLPSCGKSRFGCWVCTMVEKDKSMEAMIANDEEKAWMAPMLDFRNEFGDVEKDRDRRIFRKKNGTLQGAYGQLFHGPYKKAVREQWLRRLLEIQKDINENGPDDFRSFEIITIPEMQVIRRIWVQEYHEFEDSLPRIYEEVTGKAFFDPEWTEPEAFREKEWDLLSQTCKDLFPDEELALELVSSLIDIENRANSVNARKGILESLDKCISKNYYKNERDATDFYATKLERRKDLGGKYNEKFYTPSKFEEAELEAEAGEETDED